MLQGYYASGVMLKDVRCCSLQSVQPENLEESVTTPTLFQTCPILPVLLFPIELCQPERFGTCSSAAPRPIITSFMLRTSLMTPPSKPSRSRFC